MTTMAGKNKSMRRQLAACEAELAPEVEAAKAEGYDAYDFVVVGIGNAVHKEFGKGSGRVAEAFLRDAKAPFVQELNRRLDARAESLRAQFRQAREDLARGRSAFAVSEMLLKDAAEFERDFEAWLEERSEGLLGNLWRKIRETVTDVAVAAWEAIKKTVASWWHRIVELVRPKAPSLATA